MVGVGDGVFAAGGATAQPIQRAAANQTWPKLGNFEVLRTPLQICKGGTKVPAWNVCFMFKLLRAFR